MCPIMNQGNSLSNDFSVPTIEMTQLLKHHKQSNAFTSIIDQ